MSYECMRSRARTFKLKIRYLYYEKKYYWPYAHLDDSEHRRLIFWALIIFRHCSMYDRPGYVSAVAEQASDSG